MLLNLYYVYLFIFQGVLDRFVQIKPKLMFSVNAVNYNGKVHRHLDKLGSVSEGENI